MKKHKLVKGNKRPCLSSRIVSAVSSGTLHHHHARGPPQPPTMKFLRHPQKNAENQSKPSLLSHQ